MPADRRPSATDCSDGHQHWRVVSLAPKNRVLRKYLIPDADSGSAGGEEDAQADPDASDALTDAEKTNAMMVSEWIAPARYLLMSRSI